VDLAGFDPVEGQDRPVEGAAAAGEDCLEMRRSAPSQLGVDRRIVGAYDDCVGD
jgi:hypothetical protein